MNDLTRGPVLAAIVRFGLPLGVANLAQQGYLLVDSAIVGHYLGVPGLAAVGASQPLFTLLSAVFIGIATAFTVRLSHRTGAGVAPDRAVAGGLVLLTLGWSVACLALTVLFADPLLHLIGVPDPIAAEARRFLLGLAAGLPAVFGLGAVTAVQRGLGDPGSAMSVTILTSVLNAAFVWWFVGPLDGGITGAALATGVANLLGLGVALLQVRRVWRPAATPAAGLRRELRETLRLGVPMGAQQLLIGLGVLALVGIVTPYGDVALAAVTVVARLELFIGLVFLNLSGALMAFVAQNRGAGRPDRVRDGVRRTLWLTVALTAVVSAGMLLGRTQIAAAFGGDPATQQVIVRYLEITGPFLVLYTVMVVAHGWLTGIGRPAVPLICTVLSFVLVRLPLSYLFGIWWGVDGILWAIVAGWLVGAAYTALAARRRSHPAPTMEDTVDTLKMVDLGPGLTFWAPSEREARFVYEEIFEQGCYAGLSLPDDAFIVDVGANIGLFSYFIRQQRPGARILAFEPMPETLAALRSNADRHGFADLRIEECALGADHEEKVEFTYYPLLPGNSTRYPEEKELQKSVMVEIEPPDDVVRELTGETVVAEVQRLSSFLRADQRVDLLKIDVEGAELDVLRGIDDEHWPLIQHVVLEVQDIEGRLAVIRDLLAGHGFTVDIQAAPMIPAAVRHFVVRAGR